MGTYFKSEYEKEQEALISASDTAIVAGLEPRADGVFGWNFV